VAELGGAGGGAGEVMAIEFLDARGADGWVRKYRVMMVGGQLYPLHLAISQQWKIHYFSADMRDRAEHRAEEAKFLADMPGVLGAKAMAALEQLSAAIGLDYGGIDFALNQRGEILLFEANATMVVEQWRPALGLPACGGGANPRGSARSTAGQRRRGPTTDRGTALLICVCKEHPIGRLGSAICVRGHSIRVCIEADCLDQNSSCPVPRCGSPVTISGPAEEQPPRILMRAIGDSRR
jgi:hypothetical protein